MTENYYAIAGVLEAIKNKFEQQDGNCVITNKLYLWQRK